MITGLVIASQASLAKVYGFDGKFMLTVGDKFTFTANEPIYEEKSGFKTPADAQGVETDIMTLFVAREDATTKKISGLTLGALTRTTLPANAQVNGLTSKYKPGVVVADCKPLSSDKVTARQLIDGLAGKTIELVAVQAYNAVSAKGKAYNGKCYSWQVS